jgi:hypothetical protein
MPARIGGNYGSAEEAASSAKTKAKSIARHNARKPSKSTRKGPAKRTIARAIPRKHSIKAKLERGAKKARKKMRAMKPPSTPAVETVVVDVAEEPVPGVTVVAEFEATEVREADADKIKAPHVAGLAVDSEFHVSGS